MASVLQTVRRLHVRQTASSATATTTAVPTATSTAVMTHPLDTPLQQQGSTIDVSDSVAGSSSTHDAAATAVRGMTLLDFALQRLGSSSPDHPEDWSNNVEELATALKDLRSCISEANWSHFCSVMHQQAAMAVAQPEYGATAKGTNGSTSHSHAAALARSNLSGGDGLLPAPTHIDHVGVHGHQGVPHATAAHDKLRHHDQQSGGGENDVHMVGRHFITPLTSPGHQHYPVSGQQLADAHYGSSTSHLSNHYSHDAGQHDANSSSIAAAASLTTTLQPSSTHAITVTATPAQQPHIHHPSTHSSEAASISGGQTSEPHISKPHQYHHLVFGGGGARCLAYAGALHALRQLGFIGKLKSVLGSSGGAVYALLTALGLSIQEVLAALGSLPAAEPLSWLRLNRRLGLSEGEATFGVIEQVRQSNNSQQLPC